MGATLNALFVVSSREKLNADDRYTLRRYDEFRAAAACVAEAFSQVPAVRRVALFGSVAVPPRTESDRRQRGRLHIPKDVDLAVWLDTGADLDGLRKRSAQALRQLWQEEQIGVADHQVDIFLFAAADLYLGRLCRFNCCPKHKPECDVAGCGRVPFLRQHEDFVLQADALMPERIQLLYDRR